MKFLSTIITGVIVGGLGVYFTLDWQEEKLRFSVTSPARFGEINYQNIKLENTGWNPALNVRIYIDHLGIKFENIRSDSALSDISSEKNGVAGLERVRRDELVILSLAYEGFPLSGSEIKILSDRSIAQRVEEETQSSNWLSIILYGVGGFFVLSFILGMMASIILPAYRDYVKRSKQVSSKT